MRASLSLEGDRAAPSAAAAGPSPTPSRPSRRRSSTPGIRRMGRMAAARPSASLPPLSRSLCGSSDADTEKMAGGTSPVWVWADPAPPCSWRVAVTDTAGARLPSSRASPHGSVPHVATTGRNTCKGSGRKLSSDHIWASDKIFFLKGVAEEHLAASSHGPFIAALRRHKAQAKALPSFCLAGDDYVLTLFTSLGTSSKSFRVSRVVVLAFHLCICDFCHFSP